MIIEILMTSISTIMVIIEMIIAIEIIIMVIIIELIPRQTCKQTEHCNHCNFKHHLMQRGSLFCNLFKHHQRFSNSNIIYQNYRNLEWRVTSEGWPVSKVAARWEAWVFLVISESSGSFYERDGLRKQVEKSWLFWTDC